jgi:heavy metal sensor kinase
MSLSARLTTLYALLITGVLLFIGGTVYISTQLVLVGQLDAILAASAQEIMSGMRVNAAGQLESTSLPSLDTTANVMVQIRGRDGELLRATSGLLVLDQPFDPTGLRASRQVYRSTTFNQLPVRVLSIPLKAGDRRAGTLQVATSMVVLQNALRDLLLAILFFGAVAAGGSILLVRITLRRTFEPLQSITETVDQINRADDLSRRIPASGISGDEIGQITAAFNQTLERLETLFTSQQRFLADVSHELRTPLTVIKGNVDLMRRMNTIDEESLTSIDHEANRLTRMVGDLLLLAKAESGKLPLTFSPLELDTLLLEVFNEMRVLAHGKVLIKITDIDQIALYGDRDRLKQVLINLIANAVQYTPPGGEIFLSLARVGEQARLIVRDTGPGIPAEDLPHIFERFYRAEKSRTRSKVSGFGLGLSIAYWIVERHGGHIEVQSQEGQGTTFCIWMPLEKTMPLNQLPVDSEPAGKAPSPTS